MTSKFRGIIDQAKGREPEPDDVPTPAAGPPPAPPAARGPGRPRGKRSDPAFDQVTAYIPHELSRRVRIALIEDDRGQEFSELVAELLAGWLAVRPAD